VETGFLFGDGIDLLVEGFGLRVKVCFARSMRCSTTLSMSPASISFLSSSSCIRFSASRAFSGSDRELVLQGFELASSTCCPSLLFEADFRPVTSSPFGIQPKLAVVAFFVKLVLCSGTPSSDSRIALRAIVVCTSRTKLK